MRTLKNYSLAIFLVFNCQILFANTDALLNQAGSEIDLNSQIQSQKTLNLDNPFLIQLYTSWKAAGAVEMNTNQWMDLVFNKDNEKALIFLSSIKEPKLNKAIEASELYLLYKTNRIQSFVHKWIEISSKTNFLQTELGIALDQVVAPKFTNVLLEKGVYLSSEQIKKLKEIESATSTVNYSLQALAALRTGENAVKWIGKLNENDPLRLPLAHTALLFYAKSEKLGASGKIIKSVIEPILEKSSSEEEVSLYFMTLARLLYQAGATAEAKKYYNLIPESSKYFLKARTESLWAHLRDRDYSKTKGELATLEMKIFNNNFYPEAYLVSSMANVMLCQFDESRAAINRFVTANKSWVKEIESNISNPNAKAVETTFYLTNLEKAEQSLKNEIQLNAKLPAEKNYSAELNEKVVAVEKAHKEEIQKQWINRKTLLETALYKMNFVRIELISRMRQFDLNQQIANSDEVKSQMAANARKDQLKFKNDGVLFGDELFHMSAKINNKCLTQPAVKK